MQSTQHSEVLYFKQAKVKKCSLEKPGKYELPGSNSVHRRLSFSTLMNFPLEEKGE